MFSGDFASLRILLRTADSTQCLVVSTGARSLESTNHKGLAMVVSYASVYADRQAHIRQKISVLQHAPSTHLPTRPGDPTPTLRNLDPLQHPFSRARERMRALNAAKMERLFAKPFVAALEGHVDAVETMARKPDSLDMVASGSWDGGMCVSSTYPGQFLIRMQALFYMTSHNGEESYTLKTRTWARSLAYVSPTTIGC